MHKDLIGLISSIAISILLVLSAVIFPSQPGQAAPSPFPTKEIRGACYKPGKVCEENLTQKECSPRETNTFNYFQAGGKCIADTEVLATYHEIEKCADRARLPEAEKTCREKLEKNVKEQESGKSTSPICAGKFKQVLPVVITDSFILTDDNGQKGCVANCAIVYQCVDTPGLVPPPPSESPSPSPSNKVPPPPPPGY